MSNELITIDNGDLVFNSRNGEMKAVRIKIGDETYAELLKNEVARVLTTHKVVDVWVIHNTQTKKFTDYSRGHTDNIQRAKFYRRPNDATREVLHLNQSAGVNVWEAVPWKLCLLTQ